MHVFTWYNFLMISEDEPLEKLTLTIPANVIRQAKHAALDKKTSVSAAVTEFLREWSKTQSPLTYPEGGKPGDTVREGKE